MQAFKVYERKKKTHVGIEGNSVMEQVHIPNTPAKKTQRQRYGGMSMFSASTSCVENEKKENLIIAEKVADCSRLTDTNLDSFGSFDLNKPAQEEFETEVLLQTDARKDDEMLAFTLPSSQSSSNTAYVENNTCGFGKIEGSFMPVVQPESISQYSLKNQEVVDGKCSIADTNYTGNLKRKLHTTLERPRKRLKMPKKKVYRAKVVRTLLGKPIPRMEPKTPIKKNKRLKLKTPKIKKNVSLKKTSSTIDFNHDLEPIVSDREVSSTDTEKHFKNGTTILSGKAVEHCITKYNDSDIGLSFLEKKRRTMMGKKWELKDYSRKLDPNLHKIIKKKRMGKKRWEEALWQKIASNFRANYLKRRYNKKRRGVGGISQKELYNIFDTAEQSSPCFFTHSEALEIEENLTGMVSLLESDSFELIFNSLENEKRGPHVELRIAVKENDGLDLVATTKKKGKRQEKFEKLEHGELVHPWKLQLRNEVEEGDKHDPENSEYWDKERKLFLDRINLFLHRMRIVQGSRQFSEWDGSVMDSIIGVFLTQNVSDHLSSSAFMSLAAAFPYQPSHNKELTCYKQSTVVKIEEVVETSNMVFDRKSFTHGATTTMEYENGKIGDYYVDMPSDEFENLDLVDIIKNNSSSSFNEEKQKGRKMKSDAREMNNDGVKVNGELDWDDIKRTLEKEKGIRYMGKEEEARHMDSINWQAVRQAYVGDIAEAIKIRGQHNIIAERIKKFLNEVNQDHNEINLEWLRYAPAEIIRKYLTHIKGIGLKSVECVRLLALKKIAFPVDVNVARIVIRLGWVPIQPLPENVQIHVLEEMPAMDNIQKYIWPRLLKLKYNLLYELHYHMITFGKVFCTKRKPNCCSCPMKNECKYYLSAYASPKHAALPKSQKKQEQNKTEMVICSNHHSPKYEQLNSASQSHLEDTNKLEYQMKHCEPIIEEPESPRMSSPKPRYEEIDIEDVHLENPSKQFVTRSPYMIPIRERDISALVPFMSPYDASFIRPDRLKQVHRLMTKHLVYEMRNEDYLYKELKLERLHPNDDVDNRPYLFAMCTSDQLEKASQPTQEISICNESTYSSCGGDKTCFACNDLSTQVDTVQGTILIPCRTAMRGRFPLNGTYFQINEVFVDHESSINPITVRRDLLWNQKKRYVYFGTATSKILKGLSTCEVAMCFKEGFICVRGFNRETRRPEPLQERFHISTTNAAKKGKKKSKQAGD